MRLVFSGCCKTGQVRSVNEDAVLMRASEAGGLFLVADGVGGQAHGEVVSGLLRDHYGRWWEERFLTQSRFMEFPDALDELKNTLLRVNREVIDRFGEMAAGSTLALLFLFRGAYMCLSAGDSRIYLSNGLTVRQITLDDTYANLKGCSGSSESSAGGKLVGAVGIRATPEFWLNTGVLRRGNSFFLCSDGVYRFVDSHRLRRAMQFSAAGPERLVEKLSKEVEHSGAKDNYSMIYVQVKSNF